MACKDAPILLQELIDSKAYIDFTQGLDARFITKEVAEVISQIKIKTVHFAFDFMKNEKAIIKGLRTFRPYYTGSNRNMKCYVLTNYDTTEYEDWYRVCAIRDAGYYPYIMIYEKGTHSQFLTDLARWCNSLMLCNSVPFEDYVPRRDGKSCKELYPQILKYKETYIMATKKETVATEGMNVYQKLAAVRNEILHIDVKKSGVNLHAEFTYFELEDIIPIAEPIFHKYGLIYLTTFENGNGYGKVVDMDNPSEVITFTAPMVFIAEPAKFRMNETQGLGAVITYMRRYLYFLALDLIEHDKIDDKNVKETPSDDEEEVELPPKRTMPATVEERAEIKEELTAPDGQADALQIEALTAALKALLEKDAEQEDFVQQVAIKTNGLTEITKSQCEELINGIQEMLTKYTEV